VEEAQSISQGSIETLIPTIRAPGSRLIWSWNPDMEDDPVDVLFRGPKGAPPRSKVMQVNYDQNPWFPEELRVEMEWDRERDPDKFRHIWLGEYRQNSEARVFRNWKVEAFESPENVDYYQGADWGYSKDPSVLVRCWIDGRQLFIDYEAYGVGIEIVDLPKLFMAVPDSEKRVTTADSARPETISYMQKHGFPKIVAARKGARSLEEGVEFLKSYDIVVHPRCTHVIQELKAYSYRVDQLTGQVSSILGDKDNHMIDSIRYACEAARRALNKPKTDWKVSIPTMLNAFNRRH
jgi:phage terminase large subunit